MRFNKFLYQKSTDIQSETIDRCRQFLAECHRRKSQGSYTVHIEPCPELLGFEDVKIYVTQDIGTDGWVSQ
jgi:hypothetical protein